MPPCSILDKEALAPVATPEMIEEKAWKAHECLAEKCCCKASEERQEVEEIQRIEQQAAEQNAAREREEKVAKEHEKARMEAAHKAVGRRR
jgi:hypothetical protein